jgi:MFS family permease
MQLYRKEMVFIRESKVSAVAILLLGYITFSMFRLSLGVAIPDIMVEMSIDELRAGILYSIPLWSTAALLTPAGYLADRFQRKKLLLLGYLILGLGIIGLVFSSSYFATSASLLLAGVGAGILVPSYYTLIGEALKNVRGLALGLAAGVYYIGGLVGSILVGFFVSLHRWRAAYLIIGVSVFCMLILQFILLKHATTNTEKPRHLLFELLKIRNVVVSAVGLFLESIALFAAAAWLPTFFITVNRLDAAAAGLLLGISFLARAFGSVTLGAFSDRFGRKKVIMISGFATVIITLPLLLTSYPFYAAVAYVIAYGFFASPYWNLFITISQESVNREIVSSVTGLVQSFGLLGSAVGPIIAGALITRFGLTLALIFTITLTIFILALLSLLLIEKRPKIVEERF